MENRPIKILFLAPDPGDAARLRLGNELREIQDRLDDKDKFELRDRPAVRPRDIVRIILDMKPQIVHFSGHGMETGEICLENDQGETQPVRPEALAALFSLVTEHVKCVVLNSCYSEDQAKAIAEHIPFVIGMKDVIGDKAAIEFAAGFYTALETDQSIEKIEDAFKLGLVQIQLSGFSAEHLTPVLIFGDPRRRFRSEVEVVQSRLQKTGSTSANIVRKALQVKGTRMGLSAEDAESIINEVLELIKKFELNLRTYEESFIDAIRSELPLEEETREALQYLQHELGLRDEDTLSIENKTASDPRWHSPEAFYDRGLAQYRLGAYQKALKYYTTALELRAAYSAAYLERGAAYHKLGDYQAAVEDYNKAIELNSNWEDRNISSAYFERAFACYYAAQKENHSGNMEAAIRDWTEAIKLRPNSSVTYYNRALAHSALGNQEEAINDYTKAIEINSDWGGITPFHAYYRRGRIYEAKGELQAADQDFQEATDLLKTNLEGYTNESDYLGSDEERGLDNRKGTWNGSI